MNNRTSIEIKTTRTTVIKNEHFPTSKGNTCIAEPNLEVLPLQYDSVKDEFSFLLLKALQNDVWSDDTFFNGIFLHYQMTTNSAITRNLTSVINN